MAASRMAEIDVVCCAPLVAKVGAVVHLRVLHAAGFSAPARRAETLFGVTAPCRSQRRFGIYRSVMVPSAASAENAIVSDNVGCG